MGVPVPSHKRGDGFQPYLAFVLLQKIMQHQSDCRLCYVIHFSTNQIVWFLRNAFFGFPAPPLLCSKLSFVVRGATNINYIHS